MACKAPTTCERCIFGHPYNEDCTDITKKWLNTKAEKFKYILFYDENNNLIEFTDDDEKYLSLKTFNKIFKIVVKDKTEIQDFHVWTWNIESGKQERKIFIDIMSEGIYLWNRNKQVFEKIKNETDIFNKIKSMNKGDSFIVTRADNGYIIL